MFKKYIKNIMLSVFTDDFLYEVVAKLQEKMMEKVARGNQNRDRNMEVLTAEVEKIKKHLNI